MCSKEKWERRDHAVRKKTTRGQKVGRCMQETGKQGPGSGGPGLLAGTGYISAAKVKVLVARLSPTLRHPVDCSLPGSSIHGILQARILEWIAILFSRGSS